MLMFNKKSSGLILAIVFLSYIEICGAQQPSLFKKTENEKVPVEISARQAEFNQKINKASYQGSVKVIRGNATMYADQLDAIFKGSDAKELDYIEANGNVKVLQEAKVITAQKGYYYDAEQKIILTGHPVCQDGNNVVEGSKITYYFDQERIIVEDAKSVLHPDQKKASAEGK